MTKLEAQQQQFNRALKRLEEVLVVEPKTDITRDSAIQQFELTLDLAWKTAKTYLEENKGIICVSPKECFREAYRQGLLRYDDEWIQLADLRNETVHTYNEEIAERIFLQLPVAVDKFKDLATSLGEI